MTVPGSTNELLLRSAGPAAYTVQRSLRFNSADTAYLSRTPASAGNRKTWTWSGWLKRAKLGSYESLFSGQNGQNYCLLWFYSDDTLVLENYNNASAVTTAKFRDTSAWYHIVCTVDTTNATAADRIILYVNGVRQTVTGTNPTLNLDLNLNQAVEHRISSWLYGGADLYASNSYMAEVHFIDGQAKTPSDFAETNVTTGQWVPKLYSGTYGTNGFKLTFSDNSNTTAATLGADTSGNGNNWTPNNFSVTAGAGNDSLRDTPTSYGTDTGVGGEVRGNYATFNPLAQVQNNAFPLSNGNLDAKSPNDALYYNAITTIPFTETASYYCEVTCTNQASSGDCYIGLWTVAAVQSNSYPAQVDYGAYRSSGQINDINGTAQTAGATWVANDIISVAVNVSAGTIRFYKNGVAQGANPSFSFTAGTPVYLRVGSDNSSGIEGFALNAGQRPFAYTAPSGFKALCDTNLNAPTIAKPNTVMDTVLYTGTGASLTPTSTLGFSPDLVWIKQRSGSSDHALYDTVRGTTLDIASNLAAAETTQAQGVTAFNSNGFTVGTLAKLNTNGGTYAAWTWDAGTSNVSNTSGTITSTVRASTANGCSIVTYTGNGTAGATIGHGLGVAPTWIMIKARSAANSWNVYTTALDGSLDFFVLNTTAAKSDSAEAVPTSSVFSVSAGSNVNANGTTYVAYCWTPVAGLSRSFTWTGNNAADGPYIHLGFRPAFLLLKQATAASATDWVILDSKRLGYNVDNDPQYPNLTTNDLTTDLVDFTANGFKIRSTNTSINASAGTYVGYAWASAPFPYARAR